MRTKGLEPMKTREYIDLLKDWGFTWSEHGGKHPIMLTPDGLTRFPLSTPGKVTSVEVRRAARLLGVSRRDFLNGPPKTRPPKVTADMRAARDAAMQAEVAARSSKVIAEQQLASAEEIVAQMRELQKMEGTAVQRAKEKEMAKVIGKQDFVDNGDGSASKRTYTKGIGERIEQYVRDHPFVEIRVMDVEKALGIPSTSGTASMTLKRMAEKDSDLHVLGRGRYRYGKDRRKTEEPTRFRRRSTDPKKNGNLRSEVLGLLEDNPGRPMSIDLVVDKVGGIRSSVTSALLALSRLGCIEQVGRGIYRFNAPTPADPSPGFVSDETSDGFGPQDDQPIELVPTPTPTEATMWEQIKTLASGKILLQDEDGGLWVASMTRLEV